MILFVEHYTKDKCLRVCIAVIKQNDQKKLGEKRGLIHLTACSPSSMEVRAGTQDRNPEAETETEAME